MYGIIRISTRTETWLSNMEQIYSLRGQMATREYDSNIRLWENDESWMFQIPGNALWSWIVTHKRVPKIHLTTFVGIRITIVFVRAVWNLGGLGRCNASRVWGDISEAPDLFPRTHGYCASIHRLAPVGCTHTRSSHHSPENKSQHKRNFTTHCPRSTKGPPYSQDWTLQRKPSGSFARCSMIQYACAQGVPTPPKYLF